MGFEPTDLLVGNEALCRLSYIHMDPAAGIEPALRRWKRRVLPLNDAG